MFFATHKESGPRIIVVQALLQRKGLDVEITGTWDAQTERAVKKFRAGIGLGPGPVDGTTFYQLLQGSQLKVIDSIDAAAGAVRERAEWETRNAGIQPLLIDKHPGRGVADAVEKIIERAKGHKILVLRFTGHGNRGSWISVAVGDPVDGEAYHRPESYKAMKEDYGSYIDLSHFESNRKELARLAEHFAPCGYAEAHSCKIGKQKLLMQKLADLWGVPMSGGLGNHQVGTVSQNEFGESVNSMFLLTGKVFDAYPERHTLQSWAANVNIRMMGSLVIDWTRSTAKNVFGK